jgi:cobalt-zinc-cadmium efflux system outer membrane protein
MRFFVFLILLLSINASYSFAQNAASEPNSPGTLGQYVSIALENNAGIKAMHHQFIAAEQQIIQMKTLPNPEIIYGYATENMDNQSVFEVMQRFPWFGSLESQGQAATAASKVNYQKYQAKKLEIVNQVKQAFYEFNYLGNSIQIANQSLELLKRFEQTARSKYATSSFNQPDIIRAEIEIAILQDMLKTLHASKDPIVARLNNVLNRPAGTSLAFPQVDECNNIKVDYYKVVTIIGQNNPELKSMIAQIEAARVGSVLADKKFFPEFGLGIAVEEGMGKDGDTRIMPKIGLSIPLWQNSYSAGKKQAQAVIQQSIEEQKQLENDLFEKAQKILFEYDDSGRKIQLYRDIVLPKTKELLSASESSYQAGNMDFLGLIDANRKLLEYQLFYHRVCADNAQRQAELEMLCGMELSKFQN